MDELRSQASDPSTPGLDLQQLATNAELRPLIAKNPAAYTGLLDWLVNKKEPEVLAALRERQAAFDAGQIMPMPSLPLPEPSASPSPRESATPTAQETPETVEPTSTDTPQPTTLVPEAATDSTAGETPGSPHRTSILGQNPAETTVLPPINAPISSPVTAPGLPPSFPPNAAPSQNVGTGYYGAIPAAATPTQYLAPVSGNAPMMAPVPEPYLPAEKPKSNAVLWVIFIILLLAVIGMGIAVTLVLTGVIGDDSPQTDTNSPSTASEAPTATEKAPAPANAQNIQSFVTETGDSTCRVDGEELICQVRNLVSTVAGCTPKQDSLVISMKDGDPNVTCQPNQNYSPSGDTILHDTAMTYQNFACQSKYIGTECWNKVTGKGFFFAKQDYHQQDAPAR